MTVRTETTDLGLEAADSCCSPGGSCCSGAAPEGAGEGAVTTVYEVAGMSCGHCEGAVSAELAELPGVSSVRAAAATGRVTVVSAAPLDPEAVRAAVDEAGYALVQRP